MAWLGQAIQVFGACSKERRGWPRRLLEEGRASGLSDQPGEATLDRLETKYRQMAKRRSV